MQFPSPMDSPFGNMGGVAAGMYPKMNQSNRPNKRSFAEASSSPSRIPNVSIHLDEPDDVKSRASSTRTKE